MEDTHLVLFKGLLINLLIILILLLLANMFLLQKHNHFHLKYKKEIYVFALSAILIIMCLLLSVRIDEHFIYDLRFIPFLLGGLFGGKLVTFGLALVLLAIRIPLGGDGVWISTFLVVITTIILLKYSSTYFKKSVSWRLFTTTILSFGYSIIAFLLPSFFYGSGNLIQFGIYFVVLTFSTFFVSYLIEILRTSYILKLEAVKYEKMEIVSHLAASISHEVRNPLTSVKGFLQLILEHEKIPEDGKTYASLALDEATRASDIISDYLTFAKPHQDKQVILEVDQEVTKCKEIIAPLALKHNVMVKIAFYHTGKISGDPQKFRQVLLNICKNSIEAMPNGGTLSLLTSKKGNRIFIHITDTGHGMTPEQIARLGEPYFSLKGQKGTGLGMMVVFRIVEGMEGTIRINSEENIGTSISLSFPSYKEPSITV